MHLSNDRLLVFIGLSLLLHLAWFSAQRNYQIYIPSQPDTGRTMSVHLSEATSKTGNAARPPIARQTTPPPIKQTTVKAKQVEQTEPGKQTAQIRQPEQTERIQQSERPGPKQQTSDTPATNNPFNRTRVLAEIRQKLSHHFIYPVIARRMGWQGRVLLGFQIDHSGGIHGIHIKQSSGYAVLDNSAMSALHKIGIISIQTDGTPGQDWQLEIPVIYRLEG